MPGIAKLSSLDSGFAMSEVNFGTDTKEADKSKAEWLSGSETGLHIIPAPYTALSLVVREFDSSAATSSDVVCC